jgi:signal transduction histidine kinase
MSFQIDDSVEVMRKIVRELRPGILDELGLIEAIKWYSGEIESRSNIICKLHAPQKELNIDKNQAVIIFRIFQEIMTNIGLHSKSTKVLINIDMQNDLFKLFVKDNGIGIEKKAIERTDSFGLLGMKERAMLLDGKLTIFGEPAKGTTVILEVPTKNIQSL